MPIKPSDITVSLPCIYADTSPIWMMLHTCERFGIKPDLFGLGGRYEGWVDIMLKRPMEQARICPTSHILCSNARDAFFLSGLEEITEKYNAMGCPPLLFGADCVGFSSYDPWYDKVPWDKTKAFPYFQMGGKLAEAKVYYEANKWMFERAASGDWGDMPGDDPPWWCNFMVERPGELVIDHDCQIFQNCTSCMDRMVVTSHDYARSGKGHVRIFNGITLTFPCLLHFNGGYTDQEFGKWYCMEETWRKLGYTLNPPWERK